MKTLFMSLSLAFLAIACSPQNQTESTKGEACCKKSECCKNCTDECNVLCKKVANMSDADKATEEGKAVLAECEAMCEKNGCCKVEDRSSCKHGEKGCCDHHGNKAEADQVMMKADACCKKSDCCKNCSDECTVMCKKVAGMSDEDKATEEGKAVLTECEAMCKKNDCCKAEDRSSCKHGEKGCCNHH